MKKLNVPTAVLAVATLLTSLAGTTAAQGTASPPATQVPHKVGLIDMAHIFKNYEKFEALRNDLKAEIQQSDDKAKQMAEQLKNLQAQLKMYKEGSEDYKNIEKQMITLRADFEAFRRDAQREFLKKEADIYKTVYLEVTDAVEKYAEFYKYTLIIRFSREDVEKSESPQEVLQRLNRQVIYFRPDDEITLSVLDFLNRRYRPTAGAGGTNGIRRN